MEAIMQILELESDPFAISVHHHVLRITKLIIILLVMRMKQQIKR